MYSFLPRLSAVRLLPKFNNIIAYLNDIAIAATKLLFVVIKIIDRMTKCQNLIEYLEIEIDKGNAL